MKKRSKIEIHEGQVMNDAEMKSIFGGFGGYGDGCSTVGPIIDSQCNTRGYCRAYELNDGQGGYITQKEGKCSHHWNDSGAYRGYYTCSCDWT